MKHTTAVSTIATLVLAGSALAWPDMALRRQAPHIYSETGQPVTVIQPAQGHRAIAIARDPEGNVNEGHIAVVVDGQAYAIEIRDGKVVDAKCNGEPIPADRIQVLPEGVKVLGEDGKVILDATTLQGGAHVDGASTWTVHAGHPMVYTVQPGQAGQPVAAAWRMDPNEPKPTVMVGVRMSQPNKTLLRHLGIDEGKAIMVAGVGKGLPADQAGLKPYDLIVAIEGKDVDDEMTLRNTIKERNAKPGDTLRMTVVHSGQKREVTVTLAAFDEEKMTKGDWNLVEEEDQANPLAIGVPQVWPGMKLDNLPEGMDAKQLQERIREAEARARAEADKARQDAAAARRRTPGAGGVGITQPGLPAAELFVRPQNDERMARLEERLARLEELLNQLVGQREKQPAPKP